MTKILIALSLSLPFALSAGCKSADTAEVVLCADCGVEKGTEGCCDPDAPRCDSCDKIKGAAGCCK